MVPGMFIKFSLNFVRNFILKVYEAEAKGKFEKLLFNIKAWPTENMNQNYFFDRS